MSFYSDETQSNTVIKMWYLRMGVRGEKDSGISGWGFREMGLMVISSLAAHKTR